MGDTSEKTIAGELREAAARLRKRGGDATPGPWHRPLNTRYKSSVRGPLPEGEKGTWRDGVDPETGEREHCTVATVPIWSDGRHARKRGGRDLEWIALMDPLLAEPLASWLEETADEAERHEAQGMGNSQDEIIHGPCLAVARALNGTAS
ncbi:MAG TPA: hypothetical protein VIP77_15510 [Jiangellaceae bacterium]